MKKIKALIQKARPIISEAASWLKVGNFIWTVLKFTWRIAKTLWPIMIAVFDNFTG